MCSVGTELLVNGVSDVEWEAHLDQGWDRDTAAAVSSRFPELILQQVSEQRPHKISYKLYAADASQASGVVSNLRSQLAAAGLDTNVVFSGGEDLDILPASASKGKALQFLLEQVQSSETCFEDGEGMDGESGGGGVARTQGHQQMPPPPRVMVCGDSGNDVELFQVPGVHGCVVANAHKELRDWVNDEANNKDNKIFEASVDGPGGIVEALQHFEFFNSKNTADGHDEDVYRRRKEVVDLHKWFESYFVAEDHEHEEADLPDGLEAFAASLAPDFELVSPTGIVTNRDDLVKWFREKGRGSRVVASLISSPSSLGGGTAAAALGAVRGGGGTASATGGGGGYTSPPGLLSAALGSADAPSTPTTASAAVPPPGVAVFLDPSTLIDCSGRFRIWIDCYSEREVGSGSGVWIARYVEHHQRFGSNGSNGNGESDATTATTTTTTAARVSRWTTAVLREGDGDTEPDRKQQKKKKVVWETVHETWTSSTGSAS